VDGSVAGGLAEAGRCMGGERADVSARMAWLRRSAVFAAAGA
jgi:hypothetical protein